MSNENLCCCFREREHSMCSEKFIINEQFYADYDIEVCFGFLFSLLNWHGLELTNLFFWLAHVLGSNYNKNFFLH